MKKKQSRPTWPIEELPLSASGINIAQLLPKINLLHCAILFQDVLEYLGEVRLENGYEADKALLDLRNAGIDRLRLEDGKKKQQGTMDALKGATVKKQAGIYTPRRRKMRLVGVHMGRRGMTGNVQNRLYTEKEELLGKKNRGP